MARGLAFRRWRAQQAKHRAWNYLHFWWDIEHPRPAHVGLFASTHCCPCSCWCCGNARRWFKDLTWQEKRSLVHYREELRELGL